MRNLHEICKPKTIKFVELTATLKNSLASSWSVWDTYIDNNTAITAINDHHWIPITPRQIEYAQVTCSICWAVVQGIIPEGKTRMTVTHVGAPRNNNPAAHRSNYI